MNKIDPAYTLEVPMAALEGANPDTLKQQISAVMGEPEQSVRTTRMEDLLGDLRINGSTSSLLNEVCELVDKTEEIIAGNGAITPGVSGTAIQDGTQLNSLRVVRGKNGHPVPVEVDDSDKLRITIRPDWELTGIYVARTIPEDKKATRAARQMQKRVPSGPKQNDSSTPPIVFAGRRANSKKRRHPIAA